VLTPYEREAVRAAMDRFEAAIFKWRKTHHSVAVRMLGERRGTGNTDGVRYLEQGRTIPVFKPRCPFGHG
jgi:tryptophan 2,3-dioxygenase